MTEPTQSNTARFFLELGHYDEDELKVVRFTTEETLSELFSINVEFASRDAGLDFSEILAKNAVFYLATEAGERYLHGITTHVEQLRSTQNHTFYTATLAPKAWLLTQRTNCRIFQDLETKDIIEQLFEDHGLTGDEYEFDLSGSYEQRKYCVQYRETDFAFMSRLLEDDGLFFYFRSEAAKSVLVITDKTTDRPTVEGEDEVRFATQGGMMSDSDRVQIFDASVARKVTSGAYAARGWNIEKPHDMHDATMAVDQAGLEVFESLERYEDVDAGTPIVERRMEEILAQEIQLIGQSNALLFVPGFSFDMAGHTRPDFDGPYHIVSVSQTGSSAQALEEDMAIGNESTYSNSFTAIPAEVPFRPARKTPRPLIEGTQLGLVVGAAQSEIETDEYGRIKVSFRWDRESVLDETSSCWIPVAQPWAGSDFGFLAIPRVGHEVVVDFLQGDGDQPIVIGSVYNGECMPPQTLEENKSRMTLRSRSLGGSGGFNEITLDDKESKEELFMHAERNMRQAVKADRSRTVGGKETVAIKGDQNSTVEGYQTLDVTKNRLVTVVGEQSQATIDAYNRTTGKKETRYSGADFEHEVIGEVVKTYGKSMVTKVKENDTLNITKKREVTVGEGDKLTITGESEVSSTAKMKIKSGAKLDLEAADEIKLTCGAASLSLKSDGTIEIKGTTLKLNGSGKIDLKAGGKVSVKGSVINLN